MPLTVLAAGFSALLGSAIGSFLNVVVYRVPLGRSVVSPPSTCPRCGCGIRGADNLPVLSWFLLRGRCRDCGEPISGRYPLVEGATAVLFIVVSIRFFPSAEEGLPLVGGLVLLATLLYLMACSVALALIDLDTRTLPNRIVLPMYPTVALLLGVTALSTGDWGSLLRAVAGSLVLGGAYLALALTVPRGMGLGDVKLAGVLGLVLAYLGWGPLAVGAFAAFLLGGSFGIGLLLLGRASRSSGIPFGPWMLLGAWVGAFSGTTIWDAYLRLIGLA
ncbi:A24 family peptidase [Curtobacterium sp. MCPF17_031]|uniref:prepilin peptidase n=1 Tax=Curtobacterium sp. MCPF17_031 TaxID=2175653 RepID=UPI000DA8C37B|nr:A24 family peptidase [Curtobacterium sp. MCPF17_031]PZE37939.1 prepilin peptidase [Curtobacterium sp. MCPF17_031]